MRIAIFVVLPILALCWRDVGHMLTSAIAQIRLKELNPQAADHFFGLVNSINDLCDNRTRSFVESACWPDDLKQSRKFKLLDHWHFINPPFLTDTVGPTVNQTLNVANVITALNATNTVLKTNILNHTAERALFARYLIHMTGDIHQPLHACTLFNRSLPSGDLGGNRLNVTLGDSEPINFHYFWDTGALLFENTSWHIVRPMSQENKTALFDRAKSMIKKYACKVFDLAKNIDPITWAQQSFEYAKNTSYPFVFNQSEITKDYRDLAYETSQKRVTLAGYRLAQYISDLYKEITSPNKAAEQSCSKRRFAKKEKQSRSESKSKSEEQTKDRKNRRPRMRVIEENL